MNFKESFNRFRELMGRKLTHYQDQKIDDFRKQWLSYPDNEGYYGAFELFKDIISPFLRLNEIEGYRMTEIGSGTGRVVNMLLSGGVRHIIAVEPFDSFKVLNQDILNPDKVTCLKTTGDQLPPCGDLDDVFAVGVLHHVENPSPVVETAFRALKPRGFFFVWLYGKEGNFLYLIALCTLRIISKHLLHSLLTALVEVIYWTSAVYMEFCHRFALLLRDYLLCVFKKMSTEKRKLIIYDQLNLSYAKYYTKSEAEGLLTEKGFVNVLVHHRHGYSWTVIGTKPHL
jgi:SAM-dependent methyltransferase